MTERIAFIGFGEAGQTIGRGLLGEGKPAIRAYDLLFDDPAHGGKLKRTAQSLGVAIARDHVDAVREADLVFLAVTASSSLEAARSCLPGLRQGQLFLDINSVSPQRKIETAALVAPTGAAYVDVAVMATAALSGAARPRKRRAFSASKYMSMVFMPPCRDAPGRTWGRRGRSGRRFRTGAAGP